MSTPDPVRRIEAGLEQVREGAARFERQAREARTWLRERGDALARDTQERAEARLREAQERAGRLRSEITERAESLRSEITERAESLRSDVTERAGDAWEQSPAAARWSRWRDRAAAGVREGLRSAVDSLPVASQSEVDRVNRKIASLQRKLRKIEKTNA